MRISKENEYYGVGQLGERISFSFEENRWVAKSSSGLGLNVPAQHRDLFVLKAFLGIKKISKAELQPA